MKDIEKKVGEILLRYASDNGVDVDFNDVKKVELSNYFAPPEMYDFEILLEEAFFDSEDVIPDGLYTNVGDLINFIKIEVALRSEEEPPAIEEGVVKAESEEIPEDELPKFIKVATYSNNKDLSKNKLQTVKIEDVEIIREISQIIRKGK